MFRWTYATLQLPVKANPCYIDTCCWGFITIERQVCNKLIYMTFRRRPYLLQTIGITKLRIWLLPYFVCLICVCTYRTFKEPFYFTTDIIIWNLAGISGGLISAERVSFLNTSHCLRQMAPTMIFDLPGMCSALNWMLFLKGISISGLIGIITLSDFEDCVQNK